MIARSFFRAVWRLLLRRQSRLFKNLCQKCYIEDEIWPFSPNSINFLSKVLVRIKHRSTFFHEFSGPEWEVGIHNCILYSANYSTTGYCPIEWYMYKLADWMSMTENLISVLSRMNTRVILWKFFQKFSSKKAIMNNLRPKFIPCGIILSLSYILCSCSEE